MAERATSQIGPIGSIYTGVFSVHHYCGHAENTTYGHLHSRV